MNNIYQCFSDDSHWIEKDVHEDSFIGYQIKSDLHISDNSETDSFVKDDIRSLTVPKKGRGKKFQKFFNKFFQSKL